MPTPAELSIATYSTKLGTEPIHNPDLFDRDAANRYLESCGLDWDSLRFVWEDIGYGQATDSNGETSDDTMTTEEYAASSVQRIAALERWQPGSASAINAGNHIYSFGRVPLNSLKHQYRRQQHQGNYRRRIWAAVVMHDFNGALLDSMACLDRAWEMLDQDGDTDITIKEFHDTDIALEELERDAFAWRRDRNNPSTAEVVAFIGHGDPDGILVHRWQNGRGMGENRISYPDVSGALGGAVLGISSPRTVVLLDSCSGAAGEQNIARALHERTGLHVIGARDQVETLSLRFTPRGRGALQVTPGFYTARQQGSRYIRHRSPAKHYRPAA
ncbi:MAG TPA: hypothetical protein VLF71_03535 [Candidatus Saccharimonadales bacterium]|nr:hypothetical protein [Candidatus Saccharimonadales bacterium]